MAVMALVALLVRCFSRHTKTPGGSIQFRADKTIVGKASDEADKELNPPHKKSKLSPMLCFLFIEGVAQNTIVNVYIPVGGNDDETSGSPMETAILHWGVQPGRNFEAAISESPISHVFQFNLDKQEGGVATQMTNFVIHLNWRGAAGIVLGGSTRYIDAEMKKLNYFRKVIEGMAVDSLCCVANAYHLHEMKFHAVKNLLIGHYQRMISFYWLLWV